MNVKRITVFVLACMLAVLGGCVNGAPANKTGSGTPLDVEGTATKAPIQAVGSDLVEAETDETPEATILKEKKNNELTIGEESSVNGYTVTLVTAETENGEQVLAVVDGKNYLLAEGYFEKAYLCGRETGSTGLVLCTMNQEMYSVVFYRLDRKKEKLFIKTDATTGVLESIRDRQVRISRSVDLFGTWYAVRTYELTNKFKMKDGDNTLWEVTATEDRHMTALCDLRARDYESGDNTAILEGSVLAMVYIADDRDYAVLRDIESEILYKVYVESDGHGGFLLEDVGAESGCLSNIQYSG
ncbi:MAG: hypothetical protein IJO93_04595 [Clostridia bacterium]|nr:hypothetical protein [Clostridia bacterium]